MQHKFVIEHPGTAYYNKLAKDFRDLLDYEFGYDSEFMIGEESENLTLHLVNKERGEGLSQIGSFSTLPSRESLQLYIALAT